MSAPRAPRHHHPTPGTPPPEGALEQQFDEQGLYGLRAAVTAHIHDYGVPSDVADAVLIVVGELSSNAVRHAGGRGQLRMWHDGVAVYCAISDHGQGIGDPAGAGRSQPPAGALGGRGLWIARELADGMEITSTPEGTTVTTCFRLVPDDPPGQR
jgi:anti-sigma regulatory factor (Ser/Thr protein kinase)